MEDIMLDFLMWVAGASPIGGTILVALGAVVVIAQTVVVITPTKKDDEVMGKIMSGVVGKLIRVLAKFAPFQKKI